MDKLRLMKLFVLTLLFYLISPMIIFILIVPNYLFRNLVKVLSKIYRNDLSDFVSPLSNLFAVDNVYEKPTATLVLGAVFEKAFSEEFIYDLITKKWLDKRYSNGNLIYNEFSKSVEEWLYFTFWKNDQTFEVSNHVKVIDNRGVQFSQERFHEWIVNLINSPFTPGRSPWEVLVLNDLTSEALMTKSKTTLVVFKIHHSLVDGISILNLSKDLTSTEVNVAADSGKLQEKPSMLLCIKAVLRLPFYVARSLIELEFTTSGPIKNKTTAAFNYRSIEKALLKELKTGYGVSLTSLVLAGFAAAVKYTIRKNRISVQNVNSFSCAVPVPLPGHPDGLRNHMSFVPVKLPFHEECPRKRLIKIHESFETARNSLDPLSIFYLLKWIGTLPSFLVRSFARHTPATFLLSNFPGLLVPLKIGENECKELFFNGGLLQGNIRAICTIIGQGNSVGVTVTGEQTFMDNITSAEFIEIIFYEFQILKDLLNERII